MPEKSPVAKLKEYFGMKAADFMAEWKQMSEKDQEELKKGIQDGSMTY